MTRVQRVYSVFLAVCLLGMILFLPEAFFIQGNLYRQFPVYSFLEETHMSSDQWKDWETINEITEKNMGYTVRKTEEKEVSERVKEKGGVPEKRVDSSAAKTASVQALPAANPLLDLSAEKLALQDYVLRQFFIVDEMTSSDAVKISAEEFLGKNLSIEKQSALPQILIYHSHSSESFSDSREGEEADTVVGVGDYLAEILEDQYGYQVIHVREHFDMEEGKLDRSKAYDYARNYVEKILEENPSVEVVIDLHRDGIPENRHLVTTIDGKETAQILFYNGLSYTKSQGKVAYLPNPYIQDNLAFSFQLEYGSALYYPKLYRGIYLAGLRYNLHLKPRALLLEAGAQTNTIQEVKNAMEPFAFLLNLVLSGNLDCPE